MSQEDAAAEEVALPPAVPTAQQLTLAQAEAIAARNNLQIAQAIHQTASQQANYTGQRAPINPTLNYAALNNTVSPLSGVDNIGNYSAYFTLETSGRQRLRANQARAELQGAQADEEATRLTVAQTVADSYSNLQVANSQLDNERTVYHLTRQLRDLTQQQFRLGSAPQASEVRSEIALAQEQQNLNAAVTTVEQARAALDVALGYAPQTLIDAAQPLSYQSVPASQPAVLRAQAEQTRPEIRSATAAVSAAEANVGLQKAQSYPDTVLGTALNGAGVDVGLILPLIDFGSIRGSVNAAREQVKVQQAQAEQARLAVASDVENATLNLEQAQRAATLCQSSILPQTDALLKQVTQGYQLGASTILDVISAQQSYRQARNAYFTILGDYNQAVDQLNRAVGAAVAKPVPGQTLPASVDTLPYDGVIPAVGPVPSAPRAPLPASPGVAAPGLPSAAPSVLPATPTPVPAQ